jgi:hypothetical protein
VFCRCTPLPSSSYLQGNSPTTTASGRSFYCSSPSSMASKSLFGPTVSTVPNQNSSIAPNRDVTVPQSTKIVTPVTQLLEQLLPVESKPTIAPPAASGNTFVDALKRLQNQARTQNNAEAYGSTTSGMLIIYYFCSIILILLRSYPRCF